MNKKLYVGNLLYEVTDEDLKTTFSAAGTVASAQVIRYHDSGRSKGFGFVEMATEEDAQKAIDMFNNQDHKGRRLVVSEARPMTPRENRPGGGGQGGGQGGGFRGRGSFRPRGDRPMDDGSIGGDDMNMN